jgi:hypothetical protein
VHPLGHCVGQRQPARLAAGREQQLRVADRLAVGEAYVPAGTIDRQRRAAGTELDARGFRTAALAKVKSSATRSPVR